MKFVNDKTKFILLIVLGQTSLALAEKFDAKCLKSILTEMEGCQKVENLGNFSVEKKSYSLAHIECKDEDNEIAQYALVEHIAANCAIRDVDTSMIDYMFGVDADLKSKSPVAVFESAIKLELAHMLKKRSDKIEFVEKLSARKKLGELTKDQEWVLDYLQGELKK